MPATLSRIRAWSTEHLIDAAGYWNQIADRWEDVFLTMRNQSHSLTWQGAGGDGLRQRTGADLPIVSAKADQLRQAAGIARNGASDISAAQRRVLYAVEDANNAGFTVGEDLSVTDSPTSSTSAEQAARQAQAQAFAADIRLRAEQLDGTESKVAGQLTATAGDVGNVSFALAASDQHGAVQAVDYHRFKESPDPAPPGPNAADIRKVLEQLPKGSTDDIREVRSPEDLQNLKKWMTQDGADGLNRYGDPAKGAWKDLPDGSKVGERSAANSTGKSALDIDLQSPDGTEHWKVHINPQTGGEPNIPAPKPVPVEPEPEAPKPAPAQAVPVEPSGPKPVKPAPGAQPAPPAAKGPIGGWEGPSAEPFGPQPIHPRGSIHHGIPILGEDNPAESPRDFEGH